MQKDMLLARRLRGDVLLDHVDKYWSEEQEVLFSVLPSSAAERREAREEAKKARVKSPASWLT